MPKKKSEDVIKIDEKEYSLDKLSDDAKAQIANIQFVDMRLQQLNNEVAVADTARMAYSKALKNGLLDDAK